MISAMKELLTKRFWQDVKKTYDDALKGPPPEEKSLPPAAETTPDSQAATLGCVDARSTPCGRGSVNDSEPRP
jgi:hypothetical protein